MSTTDPDHKHWSQFDEMLEQLECRRLDHMLCFGETIDWEADLARLRRLAHSAGYGQADSIISEHGVAAIEDGAESDYTESEYFQALDASENRLLSIAGDQFRRPQVHAAIDRVRDQYVQGRSIRIEQAKAAAAAP